MMPLGIIQSLRTQIALEDLLRFVTTIDVSLRTSLTTHATDQIAFEHLKKELMSPTILQYPDISKEFCIITDASKKACGAVLTQDYNGI